MSAIILLLLASITVALFFLFAFIWGVKSGQFNDSFSPPLRILFDDSPPRDQASPPIQASSNSADNTQKPANLHNVCKLKSSTTTTKP